MDTYKFTKIYEKHCSVTRNCVNAIKQYLVYFIEHRHHSRRVHEIRYSLSLNLMIETHDNIDFIKNCFMKKNQSKRKTNQKELQTHPFLCIFHRKFDLFQYWIKKYRWFNLFWLPNCICTTFFNRKACILKYIYPSSNIPNQKQQNILFITLVSYSFWKEIL